MASYFPQRESDLVNWFTGFKARIEGNPGAYGLKPDEADDFIAAADAFTAAYAVANSSETRTKANVAAKNTAKKAAIAQARKTVAICQAWPQMTDAKRELLKITVRDSDPTPVAVPGSAPVIEVQSVSGYTIKLRLKSAEGDGRAKPEGVTGATLFSYVGDTAPSDLGAWKFEGSVTTTTGLEVVLPGTVAAGSQVFLTAFWFNRRSESGPATMPVSTYIQGGGLSQAA